MPCMSKPRINGLLYVLFSDKSCFQFAIHRLDAAFHRSFGLITHTFSRTQSEQSEQLTPSAKSTDIKQLRLSIVQNPSKTNLSLPHMAVISTSSIILHHLITSLALSGSNQPRLIRTPTGLPKDTRNRL